MSFPDLLEVLVRLRFSSSTESRWFQMGADHIVGQRLVHHVYSCVRQWVHDVQSRRELSGVDVIARGTTVSIYFKTTFEVNPMTITWDIKTGLWEADGMALGVVKAAFLVFPELKNFGADQVFSNFKAE
jgi:hypothetical protein